MTTAVIVQSRSATRGIQALGMHCNEQEIPILRPPGKVVEHWLCLGAFMGTAALLRDDGNLKPGYEIEVMGKVHVAVRDGRLIGIVSPTEATAPAVWFAASLTDLEVKSEGRTGFFKKRPARINVRCDGWEVLIGRVESLNVKINMARYGMEGELLGALTDQ